MNSSTPRNTGKPAGFLQDAAAHSAAAALLGVPEGCNDQVVGTTLSGWRYDLSEVSPATRTEYEIHLADCYHCRARQRLHRSIDVLLLAVFTLSFFAFLLATAIIHRAPWGQTALASLHTGHLSFAVTLQTVALGGLLFSLLMWIMVAIMTPAPMLIHNTVQQRRLTTGRQRL
ncbi:hypothetical protein [Terriglobus sp.]|uniref:hypothetical protein n=1 Tax=Terriglobus sp. TaxID=1889013 RepID=UPI003AFF7212